MAAAAEDGRTDGGPPHRIGPEHITQQVNTRAHATRRRRAVLHTHTLTLCVQGGSRPAIAELVCPWSLFSFLYDVLSSALDLG